MKNHLDNYTNSNIKYLREKKGIPQGELAEELNIDQSTLAKWESNTRQITLEWSIKIADYFGVDVGNFISTDLRNVNSLNQEEPTKEELKKMLRDVLKEGGILDDNDEMTQEDYNKIMAFVEANKHFLIRSEEKK